LYIKFVSFWRQLADNSFHFRLTPEAVRKLEEASKKRGMSKTVYVQLALDAQFNKDGIH